MSTIESKLRTIFDVPASEMPPYLRIKHLGAFWPHWALHKRKCDKTGRDIISTFQPECLYPVWHRDEWFSAAQPPQAVFDFSQSFFSQTEPLFKRCPIPHISGLHNENCEFTDDWWYSRNCYLCHSGVRCEDSRYSYRILDCKNMLYWVFLFECEWCIDVINSEKCSRCIYGLYLRNCNDMAFCYDCRNCHDCLLCSNLRNKQYCIGNKQLTKEEYESQKKNFSFETRSGYERCKALFSTMLHEVAWHKSHYMDFAENSSGNYILRVKNVSQMFFGNGVEDGYNIARLGWAKTVLDGISLQDAEMVYMSSWVQIKSYDVRYSFMMDNARFALYSGYSSRCENIFGCCGLLDGKNCILNTPYSAQEYSTLKDKVIDHMKSTGEWWQFFPWSFAPNPYDESWSSFHFPLSESEQKAQWYFFLPNPEKHNEHYQPSEEIPISSDATLETTKNTYWDEVAQRPFQILAQDINFCRDLGVPLPSTYYMRRIQENFRWMPYNGTLRTTTCAKSGKEIQTSWPSEYDGRILSEEEYLKVVG